jgi:hypothetical protein
MSDVTTIAHAIEGDQKVRGRGNSRTRILRIGSRALANRAANLPAAAK